MDVYAVNYGKLDAMLDGGLHQQARTETYDINLPCL